MSEQYLTKLKCDYEFNSDQLKSKHKLEVDNMKKNNSTTTEINKLKEKHKKECQNLRSEFEQSKKKRPRLEEEWIPLGSKSSLPLPTPRQLIPLVPTPRNQDPLRTIENNIKFQTQRREIIQASRRLSKQVKKKNKEGELRILSPNGKQPIGIKNGKLSPMEKQNIEIKQSSNQIDKSRPEKRKFNQSD